MRNVLATLSALLILGAAVRLSILKWMAKNHHPDLAKVIARWLAGEPDAKVRGRVREHAETEWGDYGREALRQAEQINAGKGKQK